MRQVKTYPLPLQIERGWPTRATIVVPMNDAHDWTKADKSPERRGITNIPQMPDFFRGAEAAGQVRGKLVVGIRNHGNSQLPASGRGSLHGAKAGSANPAGLK